MNQEKKFKSNRSVQAPTYSEAQSTGRLKKWRVSLGLERNIIVMLIVLLVIGMGEEMWVRFIPKYLELLGASALIIAIYGALKDFLEAIYQYPGGWLSDKLGRRVALVFFIILAIVGYFLYLVSANWEWVLIGTIFVMSWSSLTAPSIFAIIGDNLSQDHRATGFGVQSTLKRVPRAIAPSVGGFLIMYFGFALGIKFGLAISIALAFLSMFIVTRHYVDKPSLQTFQHLDNPLSRSQRDPCCPMTEGRLVRM